MFVVAVSKSDVLKEPSTLPALKVRHFTGTPKHGKLYTLARLYAWQDELALSFSIFERHPAATSAVAFCLTNEANRALVLHLFPENASLCVQSETQSLSLPVPKRVYHAGKDEQGWYWGANVHLSKTILQHVGVSLSVGDTFLANFIKFNSEEDAYGAAFAVPLGQPLWSPSYCGQFEVVAY